MSRIPKIALHVLGWLLFFSLPVIVSILVGQPSDRWFRGLTFHPLVKILGIGLFYWNAYGLMPRFFKREKIPTYILILFVSIAGIIFLDLLMSDVWSRPRHHWLRAIFPGFFHLLLVISASITYRVVVDRIRTDQLLRAAENERLKSELSFLRTQVNPHFLFNVLNNLVALSRKRSEQIEPALIKLSGLMRYLLREEDKGKVLLEEEIRYLQNYIDLQMMRFGDWIELELDLPQEGLDKELEPMLLIPFVENAFKHGTGMADRPKIRVHLAVQGDHLQFEVINPITQTGEAERDRSGIGLKNVRRRLDLLYKDKYELFAGREEEDFHVTLKLDLP